MESIITVTGDILNKISIGANWGLGLIAMALIVKVVTLRIVFRDTRTLQISDVIRPQYDQIYKKYEKNPDKRAKELVMFQRNNGCNLFAGYGYGITQAIILVFLALLFMNMQTYLDAGLAAPKLNFIWISDLSLSPLQLISAENGAQLYAFIGSTIFPFIASILYYSLAKFINKKSLVEKTNQQKITLAVIIVGLLLTPQGVGLYLAVTMILTAFQYWFVIKNMPVDEEGYAAHIKKKSK